MTTDQLGESLIEEVVVEKDAPTTCCGRLCFSMRRWLEILIMFPYREVYRYYRRKFGFWLTDGAGYMSSEGRCYEVPYYDGSRRYVLRFAKRRGASNMLQVHDSSTEPPTDITELLLRYAGPSHNFCGVATTPRMLGLTTIVVTYLDGTTETITQDQAINIH